MEPFVEKEKALAAHIDTLLPEMGWMEFDFSDSKQHEYAVMMTKKFWDTERYPGLLHNLEMKRQCHARDVVLRNGGDDNGFQDMFKVTALGLDSETKLMTSIGEGTIVGGYQSMTLTLMVTDENGDLVAYGTNQQMMGDFLTVKARPVNGGTDSSNVFSQLIFSGADRNGNPISGQTSKVPYINTADPVITAPVSWCTNPRVKNATNIGLGRLWGDPELGTTLDYIWNESNKEHPIGKIPFVGSVVFNEKIVPLVYLRTISFNIWVGNYSNGGAVILSPDDMAHVFTKFSIDSQNPCKLNWNLPGGTSSQNPGDPIVFSSVTWNSDMYAYFNCQISVLLKNGTWASACIMSADDKKNERPLDGTLMIDPISFIWHCLAENTVVSMADGSNKKIVDVVAGDRVLVDDKGCAAVVEYTLRGGHSGNVLKICTVEGNEIITTDGHVFMKSDYPAPASELKPGDILRAVDGVRHIASVDAVKSDDYIFCNLSLAMEESESEVSTFVASGVIVGDVNAQRTYKEKLKNDKDWVKRQLPEYMHADVDSYFEDKLLG